MPKEPLEEDESLPLPSAFCELLEEPARSPRGDHISVGEGEHDLRVSEGTGPLPSGCRQHGCFWGKQLSQM